MTKRLLIVDGDRNFVKSVAYELNKEDYSIFALYEGKNTVRELGNQHYDLVVIDSSLPDGSGISLCKEIRKEYKMPIIIISEDSNIMSEIIALEAGADYYIVKPFKSEELKTKMKVIFRRMEYADGTKKDENLEIGDFKLNTIGRTVELHGYEISLTAKEFDLFYILITNPGQIFSREDLLKRVWGDDYFGDGRTIDVHIRRIRRKLLKVVDEDIYIETKWGEGYYFRI